MFNRKYLCLSLLLPLLFVSCYSVKTIQNDYQYLESSLYYDLTTPVYEGDIKATALLMPIENSAMEPYISVKRTGRTIVPAIIYNYSKEKYKVTLGETALPESYTLFLSEALLAEFNRSTCIQLEDKEEAEPDYYLYVDIIKNETGGQLQLSDSFVFLPIWDEASLDWGNYYVVGAQTDLSVNIRLTNAERVVYEHTFPVSYKTNHKSAAYENIYAMNEACLSRMTESLSEATKQLAEEIASRLHLFAEAGYETDANENN